MIYLPKQYQLVVGDTFQLFYRSIIRSVNPYQYYIKVVCDKGKPFPRYYTFCPTIDDVGEYELEISLVSDQGIVDVKKTKLIVKEPKMPLKKSTILCIGDSLTTAGYWTKEGYRRYTKTGGEIPGIGFNDTIELIGTCRKEFDGEVICYEGYGGWQWKTFCMSMKESKTTSIWVTAKHNKTEADQHSIWMSNGKLWILETILPNKLKFKRGLGNDEVKPEIENLFKHVNYANNKDDIICEEYSFEQGNPFIFDNELNIEKYLEVNNFKTPDYIYILLTWNGLYVQYSNDFSIHEEYAKKLIAALRKACPLAKFVLMGIPPCSINGGIASNYGASGGYSDYYGTFTTCLNYNRWLEEFTLRDEYKDYLSYVDVKGQFDVENNMPTKMEPVNIRSKKLEEIGVNGVHPSIDGYMQIGDVFFRSLVHTLK